MSRLNFTRINVNAVSCRELYMVGPEALSSPAGILIVCSVRSLPKGSVGGSGIKPMTLAVTCRILVDSKISEIIGWNYFVPDIFDCRTSPEGFSQQHLLSTDLAAVSDLRYRQAYFSSSLLPRLFHVFAVVLKEEC